MHLANLREGAALPEIVKAVSQEQIERYAAASGDHNPIHVDREFASRSQFGGTIAQGMLIAASISEMMSVAFDGNWASGGRLKIRFKAPVYPGETVTAFGKVKKIETRAETCTVHCAVGVRKANGEAAVSGDATVVIPVE